MHINSNSNPSPPHNKIFFPLHATQSAQLNSGSLQFLLELQASAAALQLQLVSLVSVVVVTAAIFSALSLALKSSRVRYSSLSSLSNSAYIFMGFF